MKSMNVSERRTRVTYGFTFVELMIVIAIIGILSTVIVASLVVARQKAVDANVKTYLHNIQAEMEIVYTNNATYGSGGTIAPNAATATVGANPAAGAIFGTTANGDAVINAALKAAIAAGGPAYFYVGVNGASYAVAVPLKADSTVWWCVDSVSYGGKMSQTANMTSNALGSTGGAASCPP